MRKLLIVVLALSTVAWAAGKHGATKSKHAGGDWYQATLNVQCDQFVRLNQTIAPTATAFAERESFQPPAMAARGVRGEDWYNQKVMIQSEVSQRELKALKNAP